MTAWDWSMLALFPLLYAWGRRAIDLQKTRVWVALMTASLATFLSGHPLWYLAIDSIAAAVVLRKPRGCAQQLIGGIFLIMACMDGGTAAASILYDTVDRAHFEQSLAHMGWAQWAILAMWCGYDLLGRFGFIRDYDPNRTDSAYAFARSS